VNLHSKIIDSVAHVMTWIGVGIIMSMMVLTCADVLLRYLGHPIRGAYDITCVLGSATFALPIAYSCTKGYQVACDSIFRRAPRTVRAVIDSIVCLFSIGTTALIAWRLSALAHDLYSKGRGTDTILIPLAPFVYTAALGFFVYCLTLLAEHFQALKKE
jgi:TRAP-type C4-dicarboxylate transport system permease small subunit